MACLGGVQAGILHLHAPERVHEGVLARDIRLKKWKRAFSAVPRHAGGRATVGWGRDRRGGGERKGYIAGVQGTRFAGVGGWDKAIVVLKCACIACLPVFMVDL